jgi:spermidine synthase
VNEPQRQLVRLRIAFALSGCSALIFQVIWFRKVSLFLGASAEAAAVTLAVFMLGLALGSYLARPLLSLSRNPFFLLAGLELGIGAYGIFSLHVLHGMGAAYGHWVSSPLEGETSRRLLLRATVCAGGLIAPTTLMGLTFPVLLHAVRPGRQTAGGTSAQLYAANTAGAALGALLTGFVLIATFGLTGSAWVASSLNVAAALLIVMQSRSASSTAIPPEPARRPVAAHAGNDSRQRLRLLASVFFVAGFSTFAIETLWTRWLMFLMGGNSASIFALILFGFLAGIQFGSRRIARSVDALGDPLSTFGIVLMLVGATTLLASSALGAVPFVMDATTLDGGVRHGVVTFIVILFVLAPAALGGTTVSLAARELIDRHGMSAADVGRYYAINTVGCVLGALVAGFLILPFCGLRIGIVVVASIDILVGLASCLALGSRIAPVPIGLAAGAACLAAILYVLPPPVLLKLNRATEELLYYSEGSDASVAVVRNTLDQSMRLFVNGDPQAGSGPSSEAHLRFLGHLPALFTRQQDEALVIGLGAGFTTGSVLAHPFTRVTQVELSRSIPSASRYFESLADRPLDDPRLQLVYDDGRNLLLTTNRSFDVITTDPIDPNDAGATSLYAQEYYELVKRRLRPGGVAAQWLPVTANLSDYRTLVRTFQSVFPTTYLWFARDTTVAIGFRDTPQLSRSEVEARLKSPRVERGLARIDIRGLDELLRSLLGDGEHLKRVIGPGSLNTDDFPTIEYARSGQVDAVLFARTILQPLLTERDRSVASLLRATRGVARSEAAPAYTPR